MEAALWWLSGQLLRRPDLFPDFEELIYKFILGILRTSAEISGDALLNVIAQTKSTECSDPKDRYVETPRISSLSIDQCSRADVRKHGKRKKYSL
jgi:hypothetical protein